MVENNNTQNTSPTSRDVVAGKGALSNGVKRTVLLAMIVLSLVGLFDSLYLAKHKADGTPLLCNIENLSGCNVVANSSYSYLFGIPLAEFGVAFYLLMLVLVFFEYWFSHVHARRALLAVTTIGVLSSVYFISVQVLFIKALCIYCIGSAIITFLLLACMIFFFKKEEPLPTLL